MSKIEDLLQEYCPDGVEFKKIKDVYKRLKGTPITAGKMKEIEDPDGEIRIFAGGKTVINAKEEDIPNANITRVPAVLVQSRGVIDFIFYDEPFTFKNEMWAYTHDDMVSVKYLYYVLKNNTEHFREAASGMGSLPQISLPVTEDFTVPVPPIEVQSEIVQILDNFTELTAELTAELDYRKKQYAAISTKLFEHAKEIGKEYILSDICKIEKGNTPIQKSVPGQYTLVVTTSERKTDDKYQFDSEAVCIPLVSSRGHGVASLNHVYYQKGKFALGNILCAVLPRDDRFVSARYLYYYFEQTKDYTLVPLMKGGANVALHISDIGRITVPMPSFEFQQTIVKQLDVFEKYCNDELPAEIAARQKQYEYYRDRLLSFKEGKA